MFHGILRFIEGNLSVLISLAALAISLASLRHARKSFTQTQLPDVMVTLLENTHGGTFFVVHLHNVTKNSAVNVSAKFALTRGFRRYVWNEEIAKEIRGMEILNKTLGVDQITRCVIRLSNGLLKGRPNTNALVLSRNEDLPAFALYVEFRWQAPLRGLRPMRRRYRYDLSTFAIDREVTLGLSPCAISILPFRVAWWRPNTIYYSAVDRISDEFADRLAERSGMDSVKS